ncbi:MAG: bifunctional pyr operon transcriptional regulator/uracil phosphoribosyltransferase PyrR [Elusimicrobiota bacterium]|jgi:pyrimidine operon attenuation protein/uracil phosphoribosyltransferase|nr:bifunctional pyr operon transcriptional regulator/uracil phosphoribosyltransferase PyrR [Elusimicrobiota bacterium]
MAQIILDANGFSQAIKKMSQEIYETIKEPKKLVIIGIHRNGVFIGKRIAAEIEKQTGAAIDFGTLDITLYRDDIDDLGLDIPVIKDTEILFDINKKDIILVDDVLYTGRTVRAALEVIISFGRPSSIKLAALVDRGCRELPIEANFIGLKYPSKKKIKVECKESDKIDQITVL